MIDNAISRQVLTALARSWRWSAAVRSFRWRSTRLATWQLNRDETLTWPCRFEAHHPPPEPHIKGAWSTFVLPTSPNFIGEETYHALLTRDRPELQRKYSDVFARVDGLIFPTTPCAAPPIENQFGFSIAGNNVTDLILAKNTHPTSCAGLPGISIPMGITSIGLPVGLEIDAGPGRDANLLEISRQVEAVIGDIPAPS